VSRRGIIMPKKESSLFTLVERWPAADRLLFEHALHKGGLFDKGGRGAKWAGPTRTKYIYDYGRWLAWLAKAYPDDLKLDPGGRVSQEKVDQYVQHMRLTLAQHSVASHLLGLGSVLWALCDTDEFGWVSCAGRRLARRAIGKNKRGLMHSSHELAELGFRLMTEAEAGKHEGRYPPAVRYRNGLIIALLAYWPIRLRNLTSISIGEHLVECGDGFRIDFLAEETKQKRAIGFQLPAALAEAMKRYLLVYRPVLLAMVPFCGTAGNALWVAADGGALAAGGIRDVVKNHTRSEFGHALSPHRFRDCAATTIATQDPGHMHDIMSVLGHSTLVCSERHYNQAGSVQAGRHYQGVLRKVRKSLRVKRPPEVLG
jgi:integrase/recombinase XerD